MSDNASSAKGPSLLVYSSTCGCGFTTPNRLSKRHSTLDKVWHDLTRHPIRFFRRPPTKDRSTEAPDA